MGRSLLFAQTKINNKDVIISSVHLESLSNEDYRKE